MDQDASTRDIKQEKQQTRKTADKKNIFSVCPQDSHWLTNIVRNTFTFLHKMRTKFSIYLVPYGPVWSLMVPYGPVWSRMLSYGPVWSCIVPVPYGPLLSLLSHTVLCSNHTNFAQIFLINIFFEQTLFWGKIWFDQMNFSKLFLTNIFWPKFDHYILRNQMTCFTNIFEPTFCWIKISFESKSILN